MADPYNQPIPQTDEDARLVGTMTDPTMSIAPWIVFTPAIVTPYSAWCIATNARSARYMLVGKTMTIVL